MPLSWPKKVKYGILIPECSSTPTEAAYKHVFIEPPTPEDFRPGLDSELVAVILRALSKRPMLRDRVASLRDVGVDWSAVVSSLAGANFGNVAMGASQTLSGVDPGAFSFSIAGANGRAVLRDSRCVDCCRSPRWRSP